MKWKFWKWFFVGLNDQSGLRQLFINLCCIFHIIIGFTLAYLVDVPTQKAAQTILLPLAGILIGLSFAWSGNAQALIQKKEIELLASYHPDRIETYINTFQLAILVILVTLVFWGLAGLEVFSPENIESLCALFFIEAFLYFLASLTLRECWQVVLFSQELILIRYNVRNLLNQKKSHD